MLAMPFNNFKLHGNSRGICRGRQHRMILAGQDQESHGSPAQNASDNTPRPTSGGATGIDCKKLRLTAEVSGCSPINHRVTLRAANRSSLRFTSSVRLVRALYGTSVYTSIPVQYTVPVDNGSRGVNVDRPCVVFQFYKVPVGA